jgi:hypothetical protein
MGRGVSVKPRRFLPPGKNRYPLYRRLCRPRAGWTGAEYLEPTGIRSPDRPARSQSIYRLSYPAPSISKILTQFPLVRPASSRNYGFIIWNTQSEHDYRQFDKYCSMHSCSYSCLFRTFFVSLSLPISVLSAINNVYKPKIGMDRSWPRWQPVTRGDPTITGIWMWRAN